MTPTEHWRQRVSERIGPDVDADALARLLGLEIDRGGEYVHYAGRVSCDGRRLWWFQMPDGRWFLALVCTRNRTAVTVLTPELGVRRQYRRKGRGRKARRAAA